MAAKRVLTCQHRPSHGEPDHDRESPSLPQPAQTRARRAADARRRAGRAAGAHTAGRRLRHRSAYFRGHAALFRISPRDRPRTLRRDRGGRPGRAAFASASGSRSFPMSPAAPASPAGAARPIAASSINVSASTATAAWPIGSAVPEDNLVDAEGVSLDEAAMAEFLAIGAHAVRRGAVDAGPAGRWSSAPARSASPRRSSPSARGAEVTVLDTRADRLAFAREAIGVDHASRRARARATGWRALTGGDFFDCVFDCTGSPRGDERGLRAMSRMAAPMCWSASCSATSSSPIRSSTSARRRCSAAATRRAPISTTVFAALRAGAIPTEALEHPSRLARRGAARVSAMARPGQRRRQSADRDLTDAFPDSAVRHQPLPSGAFRSLRRSRLRRRAGDATDRRRPDDRVARKRAARRLLRRRSPLSRPCARPRRRRGGRRMGARSTASAAASTPITTGRRSEKLFVDERAGSSRTPATAAMSSSPGDRADGGVPKLVSRQADQAAARALRRRPAGADAVSLRADRRQRRQAARAGLGGGGELGLGARLSALDRRRLPVDQFAGRPHRLGAAGAGGRGRRALCAVGGREPARPRSCRAATRASSSPTISSATSG